MTCTTCHAPSDRYLCRACIVELDDLLRDVPFLIVNLDPILQATKVVKKAGNEGGNGTRSAGSKPPVSLDAGLTRAWLYQLPKRAYIAAEESNAGQFLAMARIWVGNARTLVWGVEAEKVAPEEIAQIRKRVAEEFPEKLPPAECAQWLRKEARIKIQARTINDWFHRGKLRKLEGSTPKKPLYSPKEVFLVHQTRQHE